MDKYILILIESSAALIMFYVVYALWLSRETFFKENRYFLLIAAGISLLVPWFNFNMPSKGNVLLIMNVLDTITVTTNGYEQKLIQQITASQWILFTYLLGVLVMVLLFITKTIQIAWIGRKAKPHAEFGKHVFLMDEKVAPFSFFNRIYFNPSMYNANEIDKIIAHENIHITQGHTIDCLFYELLIALFWFNPIVYRYRKSAKAIHEYLADEGAIRTAGVTPKAYQHLLFEQATGIKELQLANSFNYSLIKKRLIMISKIKSSKSAKLRLLAFLPVLLSVVFVFAVEKANSHEMLDLNYTEIENSVTENVNSSLNQEKEQVYFIADVMPKYPGGDMELRKFIATNVKYPAKAKETGTEGKIFVTFVVNEQGGVEQVKPVAIRVPIHEKNEIDEVVVVGYTEVFTKDGKDFESLKEEAVRVTSSMSDWEPGILDGKPVKVSFTIPINFLLN